MKKGQLSIFIILGLIVLGSVILFIYFKSQIQIEPVRETVTNPIAEHIEQCLYDVARQGVAILSEQGGYIEIPLNIRINPSRYYSPDGNGVVKSPLWFYKGTRYDPTIESIQRDLSRYVEEQSEQCINLEIFEDQFDISRSESKQVIISLNRKDVSIVMEQEVFVSAKSNASRTVLERFETTVPVALRPMITTAKSILNAELRGGYLENFTIDLMAANPDIPFTDMQFTCDRLEWHTDEIKEQVLDMLDVNLQRIRVKNTLHRPFLEPESEYEKLKGLNMQDVAEGNVPSDLPQDSFEYFRMYWDTGIDPEPITVGLSITPQRKMDFVARPHDNGVLRARLAEGNKEYLRFMCVSVYHFLYDLNYPLIVTLRDEQGETFRFVMPITIKNNEPFKQDYGYGTFSAPRLDQGFCDQKDTELVDIRAVGSEDGFANVELNDVNISLECFKFYCDLGKTKADGGIYRLQTNLPASCANPFITAKKEGYLSAKEQITSDSLRLSLKKIKKLPYEVLVHKYNKHANVINPANDLGEDMNVSIQLLGQEIEQYKIYPIPEQLEDKTIEIVEDDAIYDLDIILTLDGQYVGGYKSQWDVRSIDVANAEKVIFHVIHYTPTPFSQEAKIEMVQYILEGDYTEQLRPDLS